MMDTFELTNYNFYSSRLDMELITTIVDSLKVVPQDIQDENFFMGRDGIYFRII